MRGFSVRLPTLPNFPTSLGALRSGGFSPAALFANGEQGVWIAPSDLPAFFQDVAGTTPAAYGGTVAAGLDRSRGAGVDRRADWTVATLGTVAETATYNPATGAGRTYRGSSSANASAIVLNGFAATDYFYAEIANLSATVDIRVRDIIGGSYVVLIPALTTFKGFLTGQNEFALTAETNMSGADFTLTVFRALPGNIALQSDAVKQPKIMSVGGVKYLLSDLVNDSLPAVVPSLGSDATVAYATEAGTAILSGQTIGAGALETLRGEKTYGFLAINRALSGAELSILTTFLDAARGL